MSLTSQIALVLADSCGAGSAGGKGFSKGNTCGGKLVKSETQAGFVDAKRYVGSKQAWGVEYEVGGTKDTLHFKRKKDAAAFLRFIQATNWNGEGDYESMFLDWAGSNEPDIMKTYKGES